MTSISTLRRSVLALDRKAKSKDMNFSVCIATSKDEENKERECLEASVNGDHLLFVVPLYKYTVTSQDFQFATPQQLDNCLSALGVAQ